MYSEIFVIKSFYTCPTVCIVVGGVGSVHFVHHPHSTQAKPFSMTCCLLGIYAFVNSCSGAMHKSLLSSHLYGVFFLIGEYQLLNCML
jgi:hypothetical protein